jgi:hypothetical protein
LCTPCQRSIRCHAADGVGRQTPPAVERSAGTRTGPGDGAVYRTPQQWTLLLHNAIADNASSLFASGSASRVSERRRAIRERVLAVAEEAPWCPTSASVTSSSRAPGGGYRNAIAAERVEYAADPGELSLHLYDVAPRYFNRYLQARIRGQVAYGRLLPRSHGSSSHTTPPHKACVRQQTSAARRNPRDRRAQREL